LKIIDNCLTFVVSSLLVIWMFIIYVWCNIYNLSNLDIKQYQYIINYDAIFLIILLNILIVYKVRAELGRYRVFAIIIFILFTTYTYILTVYNEENLQGPFSILRIGLLCLLCIFNIHYIFMLCNNYYPFFKNNISELVFSKMATKNPIKIRLNRIYLFCIMAIIIFFFASMNAEHIPEYIDIFGKIGSNFFNRFEFYLTYLYLLNFIFFATLSVHVWLNLSIGYPLLLLLVRANCVDLKDRIRYKNLIHLKNYFRETSCIYLFLLLSGIVFYQILPTLATVSAIGNNVSAIGNNVSAIGNNVSAIGNNVSAIDNIFKYYFFNFRYDAYLLSIPIFINLTIIFLGFIRLNSLVQEYVSDRYQKMYTQSNLEDLDKQYSILKNASHPFDIRANNILIISEAISILYIIKYTNFILSTLM
jgi:hypothetical protein